MKAHICLTYDTITEESAENGDFAAHGWYLPGGWFHALEDSEGRHESVLEEAKAGEFELALSTAVKEALALGCYSGQLYENSGKGRISVRSEDADYDDYSTDEATFYTLHISEVSLGTAKRIRRLLESERVRFY